MSSQAARLTVPGRAIIRSALAPLYKDPIVRSPQISQRVCGHEMEVLEARDDWYRVRGSDAYEGWMHWGFLSPAPSSASRQSVQRGRLSLGCVTRTADGGRRALPLGAQLSPGEVVKTGEAIDPRELPTRFPRVPGAITRSAQEFFEGAPYVWGGITPWGADCSGLVQTIFGLHSVPLPRDAWQQSDSGTDAGALMDLDAADLAFFSDREDRKATHVAIALGSRRLVHLALGRGGYAIEKLEDTRDAYVTTLRERFLRARRVL